MLNTKLKSVHTGLYPIVNQVLPCVVLPVHLEIQISRKKMFLLTVNTYTCTYAVYIVGALIVLWIKKPDIIICS